jgi:hypothetical protein
VSGLVLEHLVSVRRTTRQRSAVSTGLAASGRSD